MNAMYVGVTSLLRIQQLCSLDFSVDESVCQVISDQQSMSQLQCHWLSSRPISTSSAGCWPASHSGMRMTREGGFMMMNSVIARSLELLAPCHDEGRQQS
jgi:hypothetical protein